MNPKTRSMIGADVVKEVLATAAKLGYHYDTAAGSLRSGTSHMVGFVVPNIGSPVFAPMLAGLSKRLKRESYSVITVEVGNTTAGELELVSELSSRRMDGLILATAHRQDPLVTYCVDNGISAVLVNRAEEHSRLSAAVTNDLEAMRLAVDHLVSLGHRKIGHIAGPQDLSTGYLRLAGFRLAQAAHGLDTDKAFIEEAASFDRQGGHTAALRLLDRIPDLTAIAVASDLLALGAYDALRQRGLRCPEDVSIVGQNDMPFIDLVSPPMTTVRVDFEEMGATAAELLLQTMSRQDQPLRNIVLSPSLVVRSSTQQVTNSRRPHSGPDIAASPANDVGGTSVPPRKPVRRNGPLKSGNYGG
ncbi:LacI family DNA-binding transcriptional regulator [Variovorax sp. Sphag1AA]|uniref:LacI family DNA-binding transcriptional regulator n=1 Tax=Variovorax sp. Sphag1AA TaxID=2587027 RepID=UPI0017B59A30|nr:LacI family DNA-binding transcriptional regulator [Variovorax sp. Sphag1AA]MBB3181636.1 LacI family transcriptional regulator [Variovorax sp. Sphag1AA]